MAQHHAELRHNVTYTSCWATKRWTDKGQTTTESNRSLALGSPPLHGGYSEAQKAMQLAGANQTDEWTHPGFSHLPLTPLKTKSGFFFLKTQKQVFWSADSKNITGTVEQIICWINDKKKIRRKTAITKKTCFWFQFFNYQLKILVYWERPGARLLNRHRVSRVWMKELTVLTNFILFGALLQFTIIKARVTSTESRNFWLMH